MTVSGKMIIGMENESISLLMEESMMESGKMVTCMEKESISMLMDMFMMVNGKMIRSMEKDFLSMLIEKRLMVCGIMMNCCLLRYDNSICDYHELSISYVDCVLLFKQPPCCYLCRSLR